MGIIVVTIWGKYNLVTKGTLAGPPITVREDTKHTGGAMELKKSYLWMRLV